MSSLLVLKRVYSLEIQSVMLVFSTQPVGIAPLTFSLVQIFVKLYFSEKFGLFKKRISEKAMQNVVI
jgi:hypothetical protein